VIYTASQVLVNADARYLSVFFGKQTADFGHSRAGLSLMKAPIRGSTADRCMLKRSAI
jgi:hypothetical protein